MPPKPTHKEIASELKHHWSGEASVSIFRDDTGHNPIAVATYNQGKTRFHSTIGIFEANLGLPPGNYEFCACGVYEWLPNALVSSVYWLQGRSFDEWPLICEDTVRCQGKSYYRHMAYIPASFKYQVSTGETVTWLLGLPLIDRDIAITLEELMPRFLELYPQWLTGV